VPDHPARGTATRRNHPGRGSAGRAPGTGEGPGPVPAGRPRGRGGSGLRPDARPRRGPGDPGCTGRAAGVRRPSGIAGRGWQPRAAGRCGARRRDRAAGLRFAVRTTRNRDGGPRGRVRAGSARSDSTAPVAPGRGGADRMPAVTSGNPGRPAEQGVPGGRTDVRAEAGRGRGRLDCRPGDGPVPDRRRCCCGHYPGPARHRCSDCHPGPARHRCGYRPGRSGSGPAVRSGDARRVPADRSRAGRRPSHPAEDC